VNEASNILIVVTRIEDIKEHFDTPNLNYMNVRFVLFVQSVYC
jgi:hypothetical protein